MVASLCLLLLLALAACALPSKAHPWCAPVAKVARETHEVRAGVRCAW